VRVPGPSVLNPQTLVAASGVGPLLGYAPGWVYTLVLVLQIACIVHVIRSRREWWWILLLLFLGPIGVAIYFFLAIVPDLRAGGAGIEIKLPGHERREMRRLEQAVEETDTVELRSDLAELYLKFGQVEDARRVLAPCAEGPLRDSQHLLYLRAKVELLNGGHAATHELLDKLDELGTGHRAKPRELLRARALIGEGKEEEGERRLAKLHRRFDGEEASYHYVVFLVERGRTDEARRVVEQMRRHLAQSGQPYKRQEKYWVQAAQRRVG